MLLRRLRLHRRRVLRRQDGPRQWRAPRRCRWCRGSARAVPGEYERHARDVDAACCGVPRGAGDGPVLRRLRELGPVRGLVVGAFGEASDDAHRLLKVIAVAGAEARWADAMASSAFAYRSTLIAQMKRLWGCFLARENARLKIARLEHVSGANNRTHAAGARTEPRPARARRRKLLPLPPARRPQQPELVARRLDQGRFSVLDCSTRLRPRACATVFPT